ncbi:hypothetical protein ACTQZS_11080 [Bilifractor sp. LCP19S3_H10]|uniref:hypothetical protein n=1 Tax=Bilifractor sp. LCP19S3_H10 TaxID=3438736 RepID=UPI003F90BEFD
MLQVISNISSIITAVTFIVYLVGRLIRISFSKYNTHERFTVYERQKTGRDIEEETNYLEISAIGDEFILEAENDVRRITFFRCELEDNFSKIKSMVKIGEWGHLSAHEKLYIRCDFGEFLPFIRIEIERLDFTRVSFNINESGKNGDLVAYNYKYTTGIKGFLYYFFQ